MLQCGREIRPGNDHLIQLRLYVVIDCIRCTTFCSARGGNVLVSRGKQLSLECPGFLYQGYEGMGWVMDSEQSSAVCCWNEGSVATVVKAVHCDANAEGVW